SRGPPNRRTEGAGASIGVTDPAPDPAIGRRWPGRGRVPPRPDRADVGLGGPCSGLVFRAQGRRSCRLVRRTPVARASPGGTTASCFRRRLDRLLIDAARHGPWFGGVARGGRCG